ncbi:hypothetical protein J3R82DRAFT_3879 [Butyriboletus roseoflavus]|nr:hypothetical protein J3R82DRAFT_3879 [Butyriboletus roseoflavus]
MYLQQGSLVLLIPCFNPVSIKPVKASCSPTARTVHVTFVHAFARLACLEMLNGSYNFNHKWWMAAAMSLGAQWMEGEECLSGPCLISQVIIRAKLALMIERVEACQA